MDGRAIRVVELTGDPSSRGRQHGAAHPGEIRAFTADRVRLSASGVSVDRDRVIELAERCLPAHRAYAPDLYVEMEAIADMAGISAAEAMIVGGYTDFVDMVRTAVGEAPVTDNCTAVIVPDAVAGGAGYLAQTWDMDGTATPHVVMLSIAPETGPGSLIFSTVGCLGQIGMNEAGIAVGINNLTAAVGRAGVTWPFVVRKILQQTTLGAAIECVLDAELAGGHNYLLFDRDGRGVDIEAMPTARRVTDVESDPLVHTNHCLAPETGAVEAHRPKALQESSMRRLGEAARMLGHLPVSEASLMALTRHEPSICRRPAPPFHYETCGAAIMRPATGDFWACWGIPADNDFEHFTLEAVPA